MVLSSCTQRPSEPGATLEIGRPAPKISLPDLSGQTISLDQFKGKVVLLDFWATWCGPCRISMPQLENLQKEFPGTLVLLAINLDDQGADLVRNYVREQHVSSRVLLDEKGTAAQAYGAAEIPMEVLLDKNGIVRHVQNGFHPTMTIPQLRAQIESLR